MMVRLNDWLYITLIVLTGPFNFKPANQQTCYIFRISMVKN